MHERVRKETEADSTIIEHDVLHAIIYETLKRQIDDVENNFLQPCHSKVGE